MSRAETDEMITRVYAGELLNEHDISGEWSIPDEKHKELMDRFGLDIHVAAAHTFLGKTIAREFTQKTAQEIALMEYGIYE